MPKISVLLSVYNAKAHLAEAVQSILNQTFTDFELIILNDASTDASADILKTFTDKRIRLIQGKVNRGLAARLNQGIDLAKGDFIARMDADDIAMPERLEKQLYFLETHQNIGVCGVSMLILGTKKHIKMPVFHKQIAAQMLFTPGVAHPTVMMRRKLFEDGTRYPLLKCAQDYALWLTLLEKNVKFANLKEPLLQYRIHEDTITYKSSGIKKRVQLLEIFKQKLPSLLKGNISASEVTIHRDMATWHSMPFTHVLTQGLCWYVRLLVARRTCADFYKITRQYSIWILKSLRKKG